VMEKYLKDRKKRKLSLDEINRSMKTAKAIRLTIELQEKIDDVYGKGNATLQPFSKKGGCNLIAPFCKRGSRGI